jgi:hypothetical protein
LRYASFVTASISKGLRMLPILIPSVQTQRRVWGRGHRGRQASTVSTGRPTRCPTWRRGRAWLGEGTRPLQAGPRRLSVRSLYDCRDHRTRRRRSE